MDATLVELESFDERLCFDLRISQFPFLPPPIRVDYFLASQQLSTMAALLETHCPTLKLVARGKVRDIYEVPNHPEALLFVATDRVSAFDVSMLNVSSPHALLLALLLTVRFLNREFPTRANCSRRFPSSSSTSSRTLRQRSTFPITLSPPKSTKCPSKFKSTRRSWTGELSGSSGRRYYRWKLLYEDI